MSTGPKYPELQIPWSSQKFCFVFLSYIIHLPLSIGDYESVFSIPFPTVPPLSLPKLFHCLPGSSLDNWDSLPKLSSSHYLRVVPRPASSSTNSRKATFSPSFFYHTGSLLTGILFWWGCRFQIGGKNSKVQRRITEFQGVFWKSLESWG